MAKTGGPKISSYIAVLMPSSTGLVVYSVAAIFIIFLQNYDTWQKLFYGPEELQFQQDFWNQINERLGQMLNFPGSSDFALYTFWVIVGLVVYASLYFVVSKFNELVEDINLRNYIWPSERLRNKPIQEFVEVCIYRVVVFVVTFIYIKFLASVLFRPINYIWPDNLWLSEHSFVKYIIVFTLTVVLLHILTILVRLLMLRKRLFSTI